MILALDLGTRTGWATQGPAGIQSGYFDLDEPKKHEPAWRFIRLNSWLCDMVDGKRMGDLQVYYEMPHLRGFAATFVLVGLAATVEAWAARHGYERPVRVHSGTIKKRVTGKGNASKADVLRAIADVRPGITDDNEADAVALLLTVTKGAA